MGKTPGLGNKLSIVLKDLPILVLFRPYVTITGDYLLLYSNLSMFTSLALVTVAERS
jgi:hypothetical protein